jgi:hypothetical protein
MSRQGQPLRKYLVYAWPIDLLECRHDSGLFACPRGPIHEQMGKVTRRGLVRLSPFLAHAKPF